MPTHTHATHQHIGTRSHQCDATAVHTRNSIRAYVLLDGIGSSDDIRDWTRATARRLARTAATHADADVGLRIVHARIADERAPLGWRADDEPSAVAVVAVAIPGELLQVAWCGDSRAYLLPTDGQDLRRLTTDHNHRQQLLDLGLTPGPHARNTVTSCLGDTGENPRFGAVLGPATGRLLLASDGTYEPLEDSCRDLAAYLGGSPQQAARAITRAAIDHASIHADNASALVADIT